MKISINIPTYGRAGNIQTFKYLPSSTFWVHEFEVEEYKKFHIGIIISVLPDKIRGNIARVRNYILKKREKDNDVVVFFDDDMSKIFYFENNKKVFLDNESDVIDLLKKYSKLAMLFGVKLWGSNIVPDKKAYMEYTPFSMLSYISASFSCFLKGNNLYYDERFSLKEDYDMLIQQIDKYRRVLRINKLFYEKKGVEQVGGCSSYRNVRKEIEQIKKLQKKWGKHIVKEDTKKEKNASKKIKSFDINPVIKIPIKGV